MLELIDLLNRVVKDGASDLILKTDSLASLRVRGGLMPLGTEPLTLEAVNRYVSEILDADQEKTFGQGHELDLAYEVGLGRFRVNVFRQLGKPAMVFRHIKSAIPSFEELELPVPQLERLAGLHRGLILATGVAGSGKSTTIASIIEYMNRNFHRHVVTVEDPIEYIFSEKKSIITQREIGRDTRDFSSALKYSLRQAPDVIVLGEMRDVETVRAAMNAAESGHLVLSTLHTVNATQTVERIMSFFAAEQENLVRLQLSMVLQGVVSLRLMNRASGQNRVPAVELLLNTPTVAEALRQGNTKALPQALADGQFFGTFTFDQSLIKLYQDGVIDREAALAAADRPDELRLALSGVTRGNRMTDLTV